MPYKNPKYNIKRKYRRYSEIGIVISLVLIILAFKHFPRITINDYVIEKPPEVISAIDIPSTGMPSVPPPPKPIINFIEDQELNEIDEIEIPSSEIDTYIPKHIEEANDEDDESDDFTIFYSVEELPEIIGGISELQKNVIYPELAVKAGIQGKVLLQAIIGKNGSVDSVKVLKSLGVGCDEAAINALKRIKFKPGMQRGKPVRVQIAIPIVFKLK